MVFCALLLSLAAPGDWVTYKSPENDFTISFPAAPKLQKMLEKDGIAIWGAVLEQDGVKMAAHHYPLPRSLNGRDEEIEVLKSLSTGFVRGARAHIRSEKEIEVDGAPGQELDLELPDGTVSKTRIVVGNQWHYIFAAGWPPNTKQGTTTADRFLNSFKLTRYTLPTGSSSAQPVSLSDLPRSEQTKALVACVLLGLGLCYVVWHIFFMRK